MTREDRWLVTVDEIAGIRWQCPKCHAALSFPLDQTITLPSVCPNCRTKAVNAEYVPAHRAMEVFVEALKALRRLQAEYPDAGTVQLEFIASR